VWRSLAGGEMMEWLVGSFELTDSFGNTWKRRGVMPSVPGSAWTNQDDEGAGIAFRVVEKQGALVREGFELSTAELKPHLRVGEVLIARQTKLNQFGVRRVRFERKAASRAGLESGWISERATDGSQVLEELQSSSRPAAKPSVKADVGHGAQRPVPVPSDEDTIGGGMQVVDVAVDAVSSLSQLGFELGKDAEIRRFGLETSGIWADSKAKVVAVNGNLTSDSESVMAVLGGVAMPMEPASKLILTLQVPAQVCMRLLWRKDTKECRIIQRELCTIGKKPPLLLIDLKFAVGSSHFAILGAKQTKWTLTPATK
jgi:hypothetical protein